MLSNICPKVVINLNAVGNNYVRAKEYIGNNSICSAVIKNDAYGLGAREVGKTLYQAGCRDFWVAYISEAIEARNVLPLDANIYFFQGFDGACIEPVKRYSIIPVINSIHEFKMARSNNMDLVLHVDSGITRLGLRENDINEILTELSSEKVKYVISHLACSDELENPLNKTQKANFDKILEKIKSAYKKDIRAGISASGGIFIDPEYGYDIVRCGAYLYGINFGEFKSENVLSLTTSVLQKYEVPSGTCVGYGATHITQEKTKIAVISIGYADGIKRSLSNRGVVLFYDSLGNQYRAKILGSISMDLLVCDVTHIPGNITDVHQIAYILDDNYTINEMAVDAGTIPYEILTSINFKSNRFAVQYLK
jgi:alanine racemase